ncbi:MAG: hypothetical protein Q7K34_02220 [archaeon]|nr:hypothetical protein [archaeon]
MPISRKPQKRTISSAAKSSIDAAKIENMLARTYNESARKIARKGGSGARIKAIAQARREIARGHVQNAKWLIYKQNPPEHGKRGKY